MPNLRICLKISSWCVLVNTTKNSSVHDFKYTRGSITWKRSPQSLILLIYKTSGMSRYSPKREWEPKSCNHNNDIGVLLHNINDTVRRKTRAIELASYFTEPASIPKMYIHKYLKEEINITTLTKLKKSFNEKKKNSTKICI